MIKDVWHDPFLISMLQTAHHRVRLATACLPVSEHCAVVAIEGLFYHLESSLRIHFLLLRILVENAIITECLVISLFFDLPWDAGAWPIQ